MLLVILEIRAIKILLEIKPTMSNIRAKYNFQIQNIKSKNVA